MNYTVDQIAPNMWRIFSPAGVYMDLVAGNKKALLIDTGYGMADLREIVRSLTDLPLIIVNTHGHVDHVCGNYQFSEPAYIHPSDIDLCQKHAARLYRVLAAELARSMDLITDMGDGCSFDIRDYLSKGSGDMLPVEEGHVFDLGGTHMRVIELPGHTMGSIGLLHEESNILYVGDAANDALWLFLPEAGTLNIYRDTLRKIIDLKCSGLVLSHKQGIADPAVLADYLDTADSFEYDSGIPFSAPLVPGATARLCCRPGYRPEDSDKPGFASIVINRDHM